MQLFANLPLDEDEQDFVNDDLMNQTQRTNFDGELHEIQNNQFEGHKQAEILEGFLDFLKSEDDPDAVKPGSKPFNFGAHMMSPATDKYLDPDRFKHYRASKLNIVCLKIIDTFLERNIGKINQDLLLPPHGLETSETVSSLRYSEIMRKFSRKVKSNNTKLQELLSQMNSRNQERKILQQSFVSNLEQISFKNRSNLLKNENDFYIHTIEEVVVDILQQEERSKFNFLMQFDG